jgi:prepilin-type N-terminal cleavage/methylation domain-containing protein
MDRIYKMMKRNNKGFTLVELMVVVLIIGILVAIAIPIYKSVSDKAEKSAMAANLRTINGAIMQALTTETAEFANANALTTKLKSDYIQWPAGPGTLTEDSYTITGNSPTTYKAQVTIGTGSEGGLDAGNYTLVGGELKK